MRVVLPLVVVGGRAAVGPREPGGSVLVGDLAVAVRDAAELEEREHPRWLVASAGDALRPLVAAGVRVQRSWDVAEVHRILHGGWRADLGRVWAAAHDGVHCFDPDGTLIGKLHLPEVTSNLTFGGPKRNELFITASSSLYSLRLNVNGARYPRPTGSPHR